ncbi:MAG: bifunctional phosphopantothenoylcysteine decarboxylase/phosphopantothenate--cysteine ligase CoaBC [Deltaproteobacteria bacterium]|nr:bifunctional phosphopantothenoylcysteine decarboxylase/phosphopantothenate--cysteine ligase CoaBC [Deltaproteobacteria bacterium]
MNVLLGITGGIAAYKSCELLRQFQRAGHTIKVIMTAAAQEFVTPKTFESLSDNQVYTPDWFANTRGNAHIELARWADVLIIAPATANTLYKCAQGKADDLLSTVYLAYDRKTFFAPAMNSKMLENSAVQNNINLLKNAGNIILDPTSGELACKEVGPGKMMQPEDIFRWVIELTGTSSSLLGKKIVLTAGPTREYIDPVRFISSPSTGTMGVAIAHEALCRGGEVTLVHGPMQVPYKGTAIAVTSAQEMFEAVMQQLPCDIFVGTAAVADYRPEQASCSKIKKSTSNLNLHLCANPDIIHTVADSHKVKNLVIGFSAETDHII